jgi:hypothetical protein
MTEPPDNGKRHVHTGGQASLVADCRLMLSFARKNGFVLPLPLLHQIGWLDSVLRALEMDPVSHVAPQLIWPIDLAAGPPLYVPHMPAIDASEPPPAGLMPEEVILDVHAKLSVLIAPTTALSLLTSEPPSGKRHLFGGMPPLVQMIIVVAFVSAICFVISASQIVSKSHRWKVRRASAEAASATSAASAASALRAASQGVTP